MAWWLGTRRDGVTHSGRGAKAVGHSASPEAEVSLSQGQVAVADTQHPEPRPLESSAWPNPTSRTRCWHFMAHLLTGSQAPEHQPSEPNGKDLHFLSLSTQGLLG